MKRLLSLLLVVAMLFGICTVFTACDDSTSVSDEKEDGGKKKQNVLDTFKGLKVALPKSFEKESSDDNRAVYTNDDYQVYVSYTENYEEVSAKDLQEEYEEELEYGLDEGYLEDGKAGRTDNKTRYVYAIAADDPSASVVAFYTTDNSIWIVQISNTADNEDYDIDQMIKYITDWDYSDPKDEEEENEGNENEGNENEGNENEGDVVVTQPTASATVPTQDEEVEEEYEGTLIYDVDDVKIYFTGEHFAYDSVVYELVFFNNTGYDLEFQLSEFIVNDVAYMPDIEFFNVSSNSSGRYELYYTSDEMHRFCLDAICSIDFSLDTMNANDYQYLRTDDPVRLETNVYGYEQPMDSFGMTMMDNEGIRVILQDLNLTEFSNIMWLYIENNRDDIISMDLQRPIVNHWLLPSIYANCMVLPHTYTVIPVDIAVMRDINIYNTMDIHSLEFKLSFFSVQGNIGHGLFDSTAYYCPGDADYIQDIPIEGTALFEYNGFELRLFGYEESYGDVAVQLFAANYMEDQPLYVYIENVYINGNPVSAGFSEMLDPQTRLLTDLWLWSDSSIDFSGLNDLKTLSFTLVVRDQYDNTCIEQVIEVPVY